MVGGKARFLEVVGVSRATNTPDVKVSDYSAGENGTEKSKQHFDAIREKETSIRESN